MIALKFATAVPRIATLAAVLMLEDYLEITDAGHTMVPEALRVPSHLASRLVLALLAHDKFPTAQTKLTWEPVALTCEDISPILDMLSHVASMFHVACALTMLTLSSTKNVKVSKKEESIIISPFMTMLEWFNSSEWLGLDALEGSAAHGPFHAQLAELDNLVIFLSTAWTRSVICTVSAGLLTLIGERSAALIAKTPA